MGAEVGGAIGLARPWPSADGGELRQAQDDRDVLQASPNEPAEIDISSH
jgi:hypothetical protein